MQYLQDPGNPFAIDSEGVPGILSEMGFAWTKMVSGASAKNLYCCKRDFVAGKQGGRMIVGMKRGLLVLTLCAGLMSLLLVPPFSSSQEKPAPLNEKEPVIERLQPRSPAQALKTFSLRDGFGMDLIASEPLLRDPVCITYDASGAMYVVEMTAYPHPDRADEMALGQVRFLLDDDGDGDYDSSFLFADKLSTPTSVTCWQGGVFVTAPPDLWYLKDTTGDHRADLRRKVITGFGITNAEQLANNLKWGIDNKLYGAASHSGGDITVPQGQPGTGLNLQGGDFCFDPRTRILERVSRGDSRWGNSFNDSYDRFVCQNTGPARHVVLPYAILSRSDFLPSLPAYQSLALEGGTEPVYRASPPEPWRVVRADRR
ncbi:MAG TPA: hypothetical protein EYN70_03945, partial [Planctomycetaceae bacterium]|nr:hypothetical protein [Planctomycetaceae bacterium]